MKRQTSVRFCLNSTVFSLGVLALNGTAFGSPSSASSQAMAIALAKSSNGYSRSDSASMQAQASPLPSVDLLEPNSDQFLQPLPPPQPLLPEQSPAITAPRTPPEPEPPNNTSVRIEVRQIEIIGSTVFGKEDFAPIIQPYEGQLVTLEELTGIADKVTQLYLDRGYITSRAVLINQVVREGVVQIRVIEGSLERIDIEGNRHINASFIRSRIQVGGSTPLNQITLEEQLRLLRLDPLFENVEASLKAGAGLGQSILTVRVTEALM